MVLQDMPHNQWISVRIRSNIFLLYEVSVGPIVAIADVKTRAKVVQKNVKNKQRWWDSGTPLIYTRASGRSILHILNALSRVDLWTVGDEEQVG